MNKKTFDGIQLPFVVGVSPELGVRGLIAAREIKKGEVIERCPVILSERKTQEEQLFKTVLKSYYYEWSERFNAIVLGYAGLINHSYTPSARYSFDFRNKHFVVRALRLIPRGEEICVNYNYYPNSKGPLPSDLTDFNAHQRT